MSVIMLVLMSVIDNYPGARAKMIATMERFQVDLHEQGDSVPSTPGGR